MTSHKRLRVGTRGSLLARTQTEWVLAQLQKEHADLNIELVIIQTAGDLTQDQPLPRDAGKGFFTKEIEQALLNDTIDIAVHSLKDLPTILPEGLTVASIPQREDPSDALVGCTIEDLKRTPEAFTVGTSSLRRASQLRAAFPGCRVTDLRGNVDTRIRKVREGTIDAAVLALAGLCRVGRRNEADDVLSADIMMPAPAQGALGIETRADDHDTCLLLKTIHCETTAICVSAERACMHALGAGCQVPVGALATVTGDQLELRGRVISLDGQDVVNGECGGTTAEAESIGQQLAAQLMEKGAADILEKVTP